MSLKLKSCKLCIYGKSFPTCSKSNSRILTPFWANACLDYTTEEPVVSIPRKEEVGLQEKLKGYPAMLPFKDALLDVKSDSGATTLLSDKVPSGEVWEVTNIAGYSDVATGFEVGVVRGATTYRLERVKSGEAYVTWKGHAWLNEGDRIYLEAPMSDLSMSICGVKRYSTPL